MKYREWPTSVESLSFIYFVIFKFFLVCLNFQVVQRV